jgi:tRNA G10  N-methylase Trm11
VDVDTDALQATASNCEQFEDLHVELLRADVASLPHLQADTVVTCVAGALVGKREISAREGVDALLHCACDAT